MSQICCASWLSQRCSVYIAKFLFPAISLSEILFYYILTLITYMQDFRLMDNANLFPFSFIFLLIEFLIAPFYVLYVKL